MDLRVMRQTLALSLAELAARAELHPMTVWRAETQRTQPRPSTRRAIARALHTEVAAIAWSERRERARETAQREHDAC